MLSGVLSLTGCAKILDQDIVDAIDSAREKCPIGEFTKENNEIDRFQHHLEYPWFSRHEPTPRDEAMNFLEMMKDDCDIGNNIHGLNTGMDNVYHQTEVFFQTFNTDQPDFFYDLGVASNEKIIKEIESQK